MEDELCGAIRERIAKDLNLPVSGGLANSARLAKLATDAGKPGFLEVPAGTEKEFLKERPVRELSGIAKRRERAPAGLGARTFGDVAKMPSMLLHQKFGIWGQQLWLFANGQWNEPLLLEVKDRTTISSATTLPYDEPDHDAALTFTLSEATRMLGQLRREQLQLRNLRGNPQGCKRLEERTDTMGIRLIHLESGRLQLQLVPDCRRKKCRSTAPAWMIPKSRLVRMANTY